MAATFQTIPTANPSESAFVLTVDDNLITPDTLPAVGTRYSAWPLGQRDRTQDTEWDNYVFVDTTDAAPGRRAFVFGKQHNAATKNVPFETVWDTEFYRWPTVVVQRLRLLESSNSNSVDRWLRDKWLIKSAAEVNSLIKIERFQDASPWEASALRHITPITDDLRIPQAFTDDLTINDCLHEEIRFDGEDERIGAPTTKRVIDSNGVGSSLGYTVPATNFADWTPFVLRDSQKQSNGLWVREKVTVYPPINAKRKMI